MGKIQLGLIILLLSGCASTVDTTARRESIIVPAPWGYSDYCSRHPQAVECSKP